MKKILLALALFCAVNINQQVAYTLPPPSSPTTISYQGVLTTSTDDNIPDNTYSVVFKLYNVNSGGTALWTETQNVTTKDGLFNVTLGSIENITGVDFNSTLYLEITLGSSVMTPRIPFTAQPYAFMAKSLNGGTINNATIGATTPSSGAFTTLTSSSDATLNSVKVGKGGENISTNTALGNNTLTANTTGANNLAVGQNALATNNTGTGNSGIGRNALNLNTTGSENTAVGRNALNKNTTASFNTATGSFALRENITGANNTAVGTYSEQFNTTGSNNSSLGFQSLYQNTTGSGNTAVGFTASGQNTTGENNTAVGIAAMEKNTTGNRNTALGHQALYGDGGATGSNNTAVGSSALYKNTIGEGNVALGYQAGFGPADENGWSVSDNYATFIGYQASRALDVSNTETLENITAIGKNAQVGASNSIVLGGTGVDAVNVGIGLKVPTATLEILKNESQETNPTALKIQNLSASSQSYGIDLDVNGGMAIDITKSSSNVPALRILSESASEGSSMTINHNSSFTNALEINYTAMNNENSGLLIGIEDNFGDNNENSDGRGITIQSYINGDNSKGVYLVMGGDGKDAKGIDINMSGIGAEQKGIYIDLTSGYDFDAENSRMGAAIGINDGIGLMVANTNNTEELTVKIATNNNALEVNGSSVFDGGIKIPTNAGAGKVLTSDANGNATWATAASGGLTYAEVTSTSVLGYNGRDSVSINLSNTSADVIFANITTDDKNNFTSPNDENVITFTPPTGTNGQVKYIHFKFVDSSNDYISTTFKDVFGNNITVGAESWRPKTIIIMYIDGAWRATFVGVQA